MYVARKDRTNASALFVSLSAVGMALGPLLALPLSHVPEFQLFSKFREPMPLHWSTVLSSSLLPWMSSPNLS